MPFRPSPRSAQHLFPRLMMLLPWLAGLLTNCVWALPIVALDVVGSGIHADVPGEVQPLAKGDRIIVNGIRLSMPWLQWQYPGDSAARLGLSDLALRSLGGIDLLDTGNPENQPIALQQKLAQNSPLRLDLPALVVGQTRYVELKPLEDAANWSVAVDGEQLRIQTGSILQTANLLLGRPRGHRFVPQRIQWSPELHWQQDYVRVGGAEFPVTWLAASLGMGRQTVRLHPIWPTDDSLPGIEPLSKTVAQPPQRYRSPAAPLHQGGPATAAINGGFFNRNNKTPLGAIRQEGDWISGPILNRGAIAWDNQGNVAMERLILEETLTAQNPDRSKTETFNVIALNSGYLKAGFSRYSDAWGETYSPLTDNEVLIYVKAGRVTEQRDAGMAGEGQFPIPSGDPRWTYLLVARSNRTGAAKLPVGSRLSLHQQVLPTQLADYPQALGAGPLLIQEGEIVLDALAEGFSKAFAEQRAVRSAIASFGEGRIALVAVHDRVGGKGPTLQELAQLLQSLGAVNALNLDGGSSTQLLLSGQILDRDPRSAALVHNGLGLFR